MIISHENKYLFVELPRTGSTAIAKELREYYDGARILRKHATYCDFLKVANIEEREYFVFSCIRNPLDDAVSAYFKYRTNHRNRFTDPKRISRNRSIAGYVDNYKHKFIKKTDADFSTFFMRFYIIPYNNWASLSHSQFDFVIRFENLADDLALALELIGLEQKRPLPVINRTGEREDEFTRYYSPETIIRAKRVFGPFMKQWGYEFPPEWGDTIVPRWHQLQFDFFNIFRNVYWRYLR